MTKEERYEQICTLFRNCQTLEELNTASILFIFDYGYERREIYKAMKEIETEKKWR